MKLSCVKLSYVELSCVKLSYVELSYVELSYVELGNKFRKKDTHIVNFFDIKNFEF